MYFSQYYLYVYFVSIFSVNTSIIKVNKNERIYMMQFHYNDFKSYFSIHILSFVSIVYVINSLNKHYIPLASKNLQRTLLRLYVC